MMGPFLKCFAGVVVILIFFSVPILRAVNFNDYNSEFQVQPKSAKFKTAVTQKIAGPPAEPTYCMSKTASPANSVDCGAYSLSLPLIALASPKPADRKRKGEAFL
jgi:hypothetical protein